MSTKSPRRRRASRLATGPGGEVPPAADQLERVLHLLSVTDPLEAELRTATLIAAPRVEGLSPHVCEWFVSSVVVDHVLDNPSPEAAILLRAIAAVGSPTERRTAVTAMGELTAAGYYPPGWAAGVGKATPGRAWRRYDIFGDAEIVVVTFSYGDAEHAIVVQVDLCVEPVAMNVGVTREVAELLPIIHRDDDPLLRVEPIELADARHHIEAALARCDRGRQPELSVSSLAFLPVVRARVRRLPAGSHRPARGAFDAADRDAAVVNFLSSSHAAEAAADATTVRFWAEVLTGYSGCVPGDAPTRVGPRKLSGMLLSYVPNTFALTAEQRRGMPDAVTAWTRWAAVRQGLDDTATARLEQHLPAVFAGFDGAYDDPDNVLVRSYLADLSATTADGALLGTALARRHLAVPVPDARTGDARTQLLDAADPAHRRTIIEDEYGDCSPPDGMSHTEFLTAAVRVTEELWYDDPPETWQAAQRLSTAGASNHEIIHELVAHTPTL